MHELVHSLVLSTQFFVEHWPFFGPAMHSYWLSSVHSSPGIQSQSGRPLTCACSMLCTWLMNCCFGVFGLKHLQKSGSHSIRGSAASSCLNLAWSLGSVMFFSHRRLQPSFVCISVFGAWQSCAPPLPGASALSETLGCLGAAWAAMKETVARAEACCCVSHATVCAVWSLSSFEKCRWVGIPSTATQRASMLPASPC